MSTVDTKRLLDRAANILGLVPESDNADEGRFGLRRPTFSRGGEWRGRRFDFDRDFLQGMWPWCGVGTDGKGQGWIELAKILINGLPFMEFTTLGSDDQHRLELKKALFLLGLALREFDVEVWKGAVVAAGRILGDESRALSVVRGLSLFTEGLSANVKFCKSCVISGT